MKSRGLLQLRMIVSAVVGVFFLLKSLDTNFLRPNIASRTVPVHVFLALFGTALLVQALVQGRQLRRVKFTLTDTFLVGSRGTRGLGW
jgi:hypothetical protein